MPCSSLVSQLFLAWGEKHLAFDASTPNNLAHKIQLMISHRDKFGGALPPFLKSLGTLASLPPPLYTLLITCMQLFVKLTAILCHSSSIAVQSLMKSFSYYHSPINNVYLISEYYMWLGQWKWTKLAQTTYHHKKYLGFCTIIFMLCRS